MRCRFQCKYLCSFLLFISFFFVRHLRRCRPRLRLNSHVSNTNPTKRAHNTYLLLVHQKKNEKKEENLFSARIVVEYYAVFIFKYYSLVCETVSLLLVMSFFSNCLALVLLPRNNRKFSHTISIGKSAASQSISGMKSILDVPQQILREATTTTCDSNNWAENILCVNQ